MRKCIKRLAVWLAISVMAAALLMPATVFAGNSGNEICDTVDKNIDNYELICGKGSEENAQNIVSSILKLIFTWVGIIAVIVIIVGGVLYITSQGDPSKVQRAKNTILYAVIGLIVSLLAFAIVTFVIDTAEGNNVAIITTNKGA